jgi:hypothetical protein
VLPSLEIPDTFEAVPPPAPAAVLQLGVIGQIRAGKGLEYLVPLFTSRPDLGRLAVAGTFFNRAQQEAMPELQAFPTFRNEFLSEEAMTALARDQHYLVMLYENWDARMEAATLYLAARVNRPVVAYDAGWCGRMVRTYGCGVLAPSSREDLAAFFLALPKIGTPGYSLLLAGMDRFRRAHAGESVRNAFLSQLLVD